MSGALAGLRVIDCSRLIAGGVLATILGDHGADVIKVENPRGGDPLRTWLRDRGELWWKVYARGKRSVTLNLAHPRGQALLRRLSLSADVLIENFLPGTFEKWGLGWDVLFKDTPRLPDGRHGRRALGHGCRPGCAASPRSSLGTRPGDRHLALRAAAFRAGTNRGRARAGRHGESASRQ